MASQPSYQSGWVDQKELLRAKGATHGVMSPQPVGRYKSGRERFEYKLYSGNLPLGTHDAVQLRSRFSGDLYWRVASSPRSWDCPQPRATLDDVFG